MAGANYPSKFTYTPEWPALEDHLRRILDHDHEMGTSVAAEMDAFVAQMTQRDRQLEDYLASLGSGMTLNVAGDPALTGAVILNAGNGISLSQSGQNITVNAGSQRARGFSCFAPGTLSARTLQVIEISDGDIIQLDAYLGTAPSGVSSTSCANIVVAGESGGSLSMPLNVAGQGEYHLTGHPADFVAQLTDNSPSSYQIFGPPTGAFNYGPAGFVFDPTAAGDVGNIIVNLALDTGTEMNYGEFFRIGIIPTPVNGAAVPAMTAIPWITDINGGYAYVDIPITDAPNYSTFGHITAALSSPVALSQGVSYTALVLITNPAKNDYGSSLAYLAQCSAGTASISGNASGSSCGFISGASDTWAVNVGTGVHMPYIELTGEGTGVVLSGPVKVSLTLTGTPATPGADANISLQM